MKKGRSNQTMRTCKNGHPSMRCKMKNRRGVRCRNRPRTCGFCALHCDMRSGMKR